MLRMRELRPCAGSTTLHYVATLAGELSAHVRMYVCECVGMKEVLCECYQSATNVRVTFIC